MAKFFSQNDELTKAFEQFFIKSDFCVIGVGEKCFEAFERALSGDERVDVLQLFSPPKQIDVQTLAQKGVRIEIYLLEEQADMAAKMKTFATIYIIKAAVW